MSERLFCVVLDTELLFSSDQLVIPQFLPAKQKKENCRLSLFSDFLSFSLIVVNANRARHYQQVSVRLQFAFLVDSAWKLKIAKKKANKIVCLFICLASNDFPSLRVRLFVWGDRHGAIEFLNKDFW